MHQHGQLQGRLAGLARRGQVDLAVGQQPGRRVDFHGHVGDLRLPGHERGAELLGDGGHVAP